MAIPVWRGVVSDSSSCTKILRGFVKCFMYASCSIVISASGEAVCRLAKSAICSSAPGPSMTSGSKSGSKKIC